MPSPNGPPRFTSKDTIYMDVYSRICRFCAFEYAQCIVVSRWKRWVGHAHLCRRSDVQGHFIGASPKRGPQHSASQTNTENIPCFVLRVFVLESFPSTKYSPHIEHIASHVGCSRVLCLSHQRLRQSWRPLFDGIIHILETLSLLCMLRTCRPFHPLLPTS